MRVSLCHTKNIQFFGAFFSLVSLLAKQSIDWLIIISRLGNIFLFKIWTTHVVFLYICWKCSPTLIILAAHSVVIAAHPIFLHRPICLSSRPPICVLIPENNPSTNRPFNIAGKIRPTENTYIEGGWCGGLSTLGVQSNLSWQLCVHYTALGVNLANTNYIHPMITPFMHWVALHPLQYRGVTFHFRYL